MSSTGDQNDEPAPGSKDGRSARHETSETQFRTALSMLASAEAPHKLNEAVALIDAAAAAGHAEAIERRAVFECAGVQRPADWERALNSLADAAELGSDRAARQLILLAEDQFAASLPSQAPPGTWKAMRSRVRMPTRLRGSGTDGQMLSADPFIRAIPAMTSAAECQWLIAAAAPRLERATLYNTGVGGARTNQYAILDLVHSDLVAEMIRLRIANEVGAPLPCLEVAQVLRYGVGEEFAPHFDFLDPQANRDEIARFGQRAATFLIYLNEHFDGGETSFPRLAIAHRGRTGDALVFGNLGRNGMPDPRTQHAGVAPTRGEKWLFSQWVRDRHPE